MFIFKIFILNSIFEIYFFLNYKKVKKIKNVVRTSVIE